MSLVETPPFMAIVVQVSFAVTVWVRFEEQNLLSTDQSSSHLMDKDAYSLGKIVRPPEAGLLIQIDVKSAKMVVDSCTAPPMFNGMLQGIVLVGM